MTPAQQTEKTFKQHMNEIKQENAEAVGVTTEKLNEMTVSEIESKLRANKRNEFIDSRLFGELRLRFQDWLYRRTGGGNSLVFGDLYE